MPATTFGLITEALVRRRERDVTPFTIMSCDNIQGNGHVAQEVFTAFARLRDPELGDWVVAEVKFPNSMVDRITPGTTDEDRAQIAERFGVEDPWPVVCEPFTQWALEDKFSLGRPAFEKVGVQVVPDVEPYELMKLRLLNASHQALCYFGYLAGYRLVHEVARDPLFAGFLLDYMNREATPTLSPVPGIDLDDYRHKLIERFSNDAVRDTVARLCAGELGPDPEVAAPGHPGEPGRRARRHPLGGGGRQLGPLRRGRRRGRGTDPGGRPDGRPADRHRVHPAPLIRSPSWPTVSCSGTWSTHRRSPSPTFPRWTRCTPMAPAPRWKPWPGIPRRFEGSCPEVAEGRKARALSVS